MSGQLSKKMRRMLGKARGDDAVSGFRFRLRQALAASDRQFTDAIDRSRAHDAHCLDIIENELPAARLAQGEKL
jgi:hypothetical protein